MTLRSSSGSWHRCHLQFRWMGSNRERRGGGGGGGRGGKLGVQPQWKIEVGGVCGCVAGGKGGEKDWVGGS